MGALTAVVLTAVALAAGVHTAVAISIPVAADILPAMAVVSTAAVCTAATIPTPVAVDFTAAAIAEVAADTLPAVVPVVAHQLAHRREAVVRMEQLLLSIIQHVPLHQADREPTALPQAMASGTRLEAAGIPHSRQREDHQPPSRKGSGIRLGAVEILLQARRADHRLPSAMANGTRLEAAGILPQRRGADHRARGREAQRKPGVVRGTKRLLTALGRRRSGRARRRDGRQIAGYLDQVEGWRNSLQKRPGRRFPGAA